jgi:hypothetical protein
MRFARKNFHDGVDNKTVSKQWSKTIPPLSKKDNWNGFAEILPLALDQVRPATTNLASNSDIINRKEFTRKLNG